MLNFYSNGTTGLIKASWGLLSQTIENAKKFCQNGCFSATVFAERSDLGQVTVWSTEKERVCTFVIPEDSFLMWGRWQYNEEDGEWYQKP